MSLRRSGRACGALRAALALCLLGVGTPALAEGASAPLRLRYGWTPGQTWRGVWSVVREMRLADDVQRDRTLARFEYLVQAGASPHDVRLEARMLSQESEAEGASPLDFSPIVFRSGIDARGLLRGASFDVADALPPAVPGVPPDPVGYRRMLRQIAAAWRGSVFWFPELPEGPLAPGEAFIVSDERDLADAQPGVAMRVNRTRSYRLIGVSAGVARFRVEQDSRVDAASGDSEIASQERSEGEALFDLAQGMWTRQELVSTQRAHYTGAPEAVGTGEATSRSVTTIEMQRAGAAAP